ncbi:hypothetical protein [Bradyrhizobium sp. ORS 86]|uniref:hypothetical protein n=1 Tax=Bradyrhizobium sp. ORS 86 TaxID=1685970 RepID=UPI00388CEDB5
MTDRTIVYDGALPQANDILNTSKFAMLGDAFMALATLGNSGSNPSTVVAGLACTPTLPASLQVNVGPGVIFSVDQVDATAYGDLGTDSNQVYKMGIREATGTLTITPPSTSGFSQVFLVQAILSDIDAGSTVLSYFNSANPSIPLSGPSNSGISQNTTRTCVCTVALKAGVAATTGTQVNPAPDAGYTALYYITVANGATQITSGNIVQVGGGFEPFVNTALPYMPRAVQTGGWNWVVDSGTASNLVVTMSPAPLAYVGGLEVKVKVSAAPIGASVINVNGLGNKSIVNPDGSPITSNQWTAAAILRLVYDGTSFQLTSASKSAGTTIPLQANATFYVNSSLGSDSFDGTSATHTSGTVGPWATLQHAMDVITQYNLNGFNITVNVANGTYANGLTLKALGGSGNVFWVGNSTTPSNVNCQTVNRTSLIATDASKVHQFNGFKWGASNGGSPTDEMAGVIANGSTQLLMTNCEWGACVDAGVKCLGAARVRLDGQVRIAGNMLAFIECFLNGIVDSLNISAPTVSLTYTVPVTFSTAQVWAYQGGEVQFVYASTTNPGNASGKRYQSDYQGMIQTNGGGVNYYPGTVAGTTNGGQYA